ncbi:hypothetical protein EV714DRAFT_254174 [Schizophyllum commune]
MRFLLISLLFVGALASPVIVPGDSQQVLTEGSLTEAGDVFPGWYDPRQYGGRFLDYATKRGRGEPLNAIISAHSDPFVLTEAGFLAYSQSIGFAQECLGLHKGYVHEADLGNGREFEHYLHRESYFPVLGTCWESLAGGNHFRAWKQNGTLANSGAWFLGVSREKDTSKHHMIVPNGYNLGRDWLVERAVAGSRWRGNWWKADVEWRAGLLEPGKRGVNHGIEQDGLVAILTVKRL